MTSKEKHSPANPSADENIRTVARQTLETAAITAFRNNTQPLGDLLSRSLGYLIAFCTNVVDSAARKIDSKKDNQRRGGKIIQDYDRFRKAE